VVFPYKGYNKRIDETTYEKIGDWDIDSNNWEYRGADNHSISNQEEGFFFNVNEIKKGEITVTSTSLIDLFLDIQDDKIIVQLLSENESTLLVKKGDKLFKETMLLAGESKSFSIK
jgi:hypothetical protein